MKKKIAIKKQQRAVKPKPRKAKAKTAKEPEFNGRASSGGRLTRAQDKEYRRQMGWPAR
jgi:hypothetical protein